MDFWYRQILQDWTANLQTSLKSRLVLCLFRMTQSVYSIPWLGPFMVIPFKVIYQIGVEWILGIEIPWDTSIGPVLTLQHGHGIVINHQCLIGHHCTLRHTTTIGNKQNADGSLTGVPRIGNYVDIGCHVVILGNIDIGDRAVIGAGSVVLHDVPPGGVVVGNPARLLRVKGSKPSDRSGTSRLERSERMYETQLGS